MGDGRAQSLALELGGILSIAVVRKPGDLKRKRENEFVDTSVIESLADFGTLPQLEIREDKTFDSVNGALL